VADCKYVWTNVSGVRSEGTLEWWGHRKYNDDVTTMTSRYDDFTACQRACVEDVIGCVAVEYQPSSGRCWLQTNSSQLVSTSSPAEDFVQYSLNVTCLQPVTGGIP